ncbi:unnamed protein product [Rotaria sordida]|uniref:Kazal-like domain-containing protein n=1 Tax=Rotaria sordida TaxID=392033 RepID=A0A815D6T4_9BILA|nr:unnamed protein product [Rotaria sordida]CAF3552922.1 unnamed protein product [Rotaria sordida]
MMPTVVIQTIDKSVDNDDTHSKYKLYGWGNFRISSILSRPLFAYIILCTCNFVQNFSVNGANNAVISTLERVFYLNSVQSGLFLAFYDLATVFSSPLVGYLGSRYSSPIFFSINMIIVGIGNMLIASSNFVYQDTRFNLNSELIELLSTDYDLLYQCYNDPFNEKNMTDLSCPRQGHLSRKSENAKFLLYVGNFINGLGSVALFTIGIAYIERIFPRDKAAYCQGIYFAVGTVGGALGIVSTGRFLLMYTKLTPRRRLPSWLTPNHPLWIGCWWLPYIIYGALCFVIGLFVSGLPNFEKPGKKHTTDTSTLALPAQNDSNLSIPQLVRENSATSISMLSSCPQTPALNNDSSELNSDSKNQFENTLPSLKPLINEYRLSNRKLRQLSPLEHNSTTNLSLNMKNTKESYINHAYSMESVYNQMPITDSIPLPSTTTNSISPVPSSSTTTTTTTTTTVSSSPQIPKRTISQNLKHMCSVIGELMKNTRYICIIIANLFEGILIKGFVPFITKYFEYQHQLDTSTATLVTGAIALLSVIIGCPLGAWCLNKFAWTPMRCARICGIVFTISSFLFLFLTFSCPELKFEYSPCTTNNTACCQNVYRPVCMVNNTRKMFLSPCHYGCTNQTTLSDDNTNYYSSCNCAGDSTVRLTETACRFRRIPCIMIFALTMTGATLVVFFTAFIQVPLLQVLLYSVPLPYQSMALGLRQTIVRVLGQTTGPLLFGFVFDQSCLVWLTDCYGRQTCKVYDNRRMGISMALSGFSTRIISGIACIIVFIHWKSKVSNEVIIPTNSLAIATNNSIDKKENGEATKL